MSIVSLIKKDKMRVFRRLYLKRRLSGGEYESTWQRIPDEDIVSWGSLEYSIDDVQADFYTFEGLKFSVINNDGYYSDVSDDKSFFYEALTRHRTLVKLEAGYTDSDGTEYPTNSTLFVGLFSEDMPYKEDSVVDFDTKHLVSIFEDFPADRIDGMNSTQTASEIIERIRDYQDAGSNYFFQKFITTGAWNVSTTTTYYNMATTTSLNNMSCWKLMQKLAGAENYVVYVSRDGQFYFQPKTATQSTSVYHFSGLGDDDKTYGHNIISFGEVDEGIRQVYNRVSVKHDKDDTTTSYYIKNESWEWGDSSSSFLHGIREYKYENEWLNTATAETIADSIYDEYKWPKQLITMDVKFVPQLSLNDRVDVTYKTIRYSGDTLWGLFLWGYGVWGERFGYNIFIDDTDYRITKIDHSIDNFVTTLKLRAI